MRTRNALIGSGVKRLEDPRFLRGRGTYVDDLARPGMLFAAIARSPAAHGRLRGIDKGSALAMPGVHAVLDATDVTAALGRVPTIPIRLMPLPELDPFEQPVIANRKVRFVGEPIAVVLADTRARAEDALAALDVDIEDLPAVTGPDAPAALFEDCPDNTAIVYRAVKGDADRAFAEADFVVRDRLSVQRHTAVPMEPRGLLAEWDAAVGRLTLFGAAKAPFANRSMLADQLGLERDAVTLIENDVGGGFGVRGEFYPEDFLVPFAAWRLGRPVKWIEDRREHLLASGHAREADGEIEIAAKADGTITGLRGTAAMDVGAYIRTNGTIGPRNLGQFLSGPYRIEHIDVSVRAALSNKAPAGTYRGPGRFEADFFRERLIDRLARASGVDRVEIRRRNLVRAADQPYPIATVRPFERAESFDSGDHVDTLDRCLAAFGWADKAPLQGRLIDGRHHGLGLGCFIEGGGSGPRENAKLILEPDGRVAVHVGSSAIGQGLETAHAQIAADALDRPLAAISAVRHGSTDLVREGFGSYHSRAVVMGGSAILLAAESLKAKIRAAAAERFGCAPEDVAIEDGETLIAPGRDPLPLAAVAGLGIEAEEVHDNSAFRHTYAYGAHAAHVAVDPETGHVAVLDYVAIEDVGRIINPVTLKGQAVGGIVQGLGGALLERMDYDASGQPLFGTLADYLMPSSCDSGGIRAEMLELSPSPVNPLGAKGGGEGGVIPVGGVIANAVAAAFADLGIEPGALPLSPPALWRMIRDATEAANEPKG